MQDHRHDDGYYAYAPFEDHLLTGPAEPRGQRGLWPVWWVLLLLAGVWLIVRLVDRAEAREQRLLHQTCLADGRPEHECRAMLGSRW